MTEQSPSSAPSGSQPWQNSSLAQPYGGQQAPATSEERTWAIMAHLAAPIAAVASAGWLSVVGPLIVWMIGKDKSAFIRRAAAGAFNFTITMWLFSVLGWILTATLVFAVLGIPMIIIGSLGSIVLGVLGAVRTANGGAFVYPWQVRILS